LQLGGILSNLQCKQDPVLLLENPGSIAPERDLDFWSKTIQKQLSSLEKRSLKLSMASPSSSNGTAASLPNHPTTGPEIKKQRASAGPESKSFHFNQPLIDPGPLNKKESCSLEEYEKLEKMMQKYEEEIRSHVRVENQLKMYIETLQTGSEESQKASQKQINQLKNTIAVLFSNQKKTLGLFLKGIGVAK
jgi:hypothetical protein